MSLTYAGAVPVPAPQKAALAVLVTGASRGIGLELVRQYAEAHSDNLVFAAVRDPSKASSKAVVELAASHSNVRVVALNVDRHDTVQASVAAVRGVTQHLDVLINNAGETSSQQGRSALTVTADEFESVFHTNATGSLVVTQAYLPLLRASRVVGGARVVNVSSALGSTQFATLFGPTVAYGVSKAAVNYITVVLAKEVPELVFLSVHPGVVQTDMAKNAGIQAPTTVSDSAQGIRYYVAELGKASSGGFIDIMTGKQIPY